MNALGCYALALTCVLLGPFLAMADEQPATTNSIESLTAEQARKLVADFNGEHLNLSGLTTLNVDTAELLAEFEGDGLHLNGLTSVDTDTARALAGLKCRRLALNGLTMLSADTAEALAEYRGDFLSLKGLTTLDARTAKAIAGSMAWNGQLPRLTTLDADTAKALAEFEGHRLYLNGPFTLSAGAAEALAEFKGVVVSMSLLSSLGQNVPLTKETSRLVSAMAKQPDREISLEGVTHFDMVDAVEIARILATVEGQLSLPNLKQISPKTLSALIEKRNVEIPLIETLELIHEPDGTITDDFVIPEWLQRRQR